jgi:hypothetical protein
MAACSSALVLIHHLMSNRTCVARLKLRIVSDCVRALLTEIFAMAGLCFNMIVTVGLGLILEYFPNIFPINPAMPRFSR